MDQQRIYVNVKHQYEGVPVALLVYVALYFTPGFLLGVYVNVWAGVAFMTLGAILFAMFEWRSFYPKRLIVNRDGFAIECDRGGCVRLGYDKIHEARWEKAPRRARRIFGPLVFLEPMWTLQMGGDMQLVIMHAGEAVVLRSDEYERIEEFVEILKKRNVMGLVDRERTVRREFGKNLS